MESEVSKMAIMTMKDVKRIKSLTQVFYMVRMK
jgi:hypothetical protein